MKTLNVSLACVTAAATVKPKVEIRIVGRDQDDLLTTNETAELLGKTANCLQAMRAKKYGPPPMKVLGRVVYRVGDVETYLKRRLTKQAA